MSARTGIRYFSNDDPVQSLERSPRDEILPQLHKLITKWPPRDGTFPAELCHGLFAGPVSIAYLLFKISEPGSGYEDVKVEDRNLRQWADTYLEFAVGIFSPEYEASFPKQHRWGLQSDRPAQYALKAAFHKDEQALQDFLALLPKVLETGEGEVWNDFLLGRTGYLYMLRLIRQSWPQAPIPPTVFKEFLDRILLDGKMKWTFMEYYCIGAGHGWISIVTQILLTDQSYAAECKPIIAEVLDQQFLVEGDPNFGNWDAWLNIETKRESRPQIQWSHGAPGVVMSLEAILPAYKSSDPEFALRMEKAIAVAQEVIWKQGLLRKESCICHGTAGNSLALTNRKRKEHFLTWSTEDVVEKALEDGSSEASSSPSGLFRGLAGRIWAFYAFEKGTSDCIGYSDL